MENSNKLVTLYEDYTQNLNLSAEQKEGLLELKDIIGSQNVNVQINNQVQVRKFVGFFVNKKIKLQILPKIYINNTSVDGDTQIKESVKLFFRLLEFTNYHNLKEVPKPSAIDAYTGSILEVFIGLLAKKFIEQYERSINRSYNTEEDNLILIRGKILFGQSLRRNSFLAYKHYCQYDEFSENNLLNRIFKAVFTYLIKITTLPESLRRLKQILTYLEDVEDIRLTKEEFDKVKFIRLNENYRPLFNLAKMFYFNSQPGFKEGDEHTFSFLIPLNLLFENYVYHLVKEALAGSEFEVCYQGPSKALAEHNGKPDWYQKPDITVMHNKKFVMILDAKYQNLYKGDEFKPVMANVYQLLSYAVNYKCPKIFIISPAFKGSPVLNSNANTYLIGRYKKIELRYIQIELRENDNSLKTILFGLLNNTYQLTS